MRASPALKRTRRVFVFGGVSAPGMYPLTPDLTIVEVLARGGLITNHRDGSRGRHQPEVTTATAGLGYTHRSQLTARFLGCESAWGVELIG